MNSTTTSQPGQPRWRARAAWLGLIPALIILCVAAGPQPESNRGHDDGDATRVEGTWEVTVTQPDGTQFPSLVTFGAGGALVVTDGGQSPASGHVYQGTWAQTGRRKVTFTFLGFKYDPNTGARDIYVRNHETIKLNQDGQTYDSIESVLEILDLNKNVLVTIPSATHGKRIPAQFQ